MTVAEYGGFGGVLGLLLISAVALIVKWRLEERRLNRERDHDRALLRKQSWNWARHHRPILFDQDRKEDE